MVLYKHMSDKDYGYLYRVDDKVGVGKGTIIIFAHGDRSLPVRLKLVIR